MRALLAILLMMVMSPPALAVEPDEVLDDPVLEERARAISRGLRCVTCQSQSIDDSNAPLAKDLRLVVRERLLAGDSDQEVMMFMTERYGDYVRLSPVFRQDTAILWIAPPIILILAIGGAVIYFRQMQSNMHTENPDTENLNTEYQNKENQDNDSKYTEGIETENPHNNETMNSENKNDNGGGATA